jgi:hypothetical protein
MSSWTRPTNPRPIWLGLYVVVNTICALIIYNGNRLLGETQDLRLDDRSLVFPAALVVVLSYIGLLALVFPAVSRMKVAPKAAATPAQSKAAGIVLFVLQLGFIVFFETTGTFVAGSTERSDSIFSAVWALVSVDSLFFIYYGFHRDSRLFWPNLAIAVLSNLLRGWTGIFLLIAFMESARAMRRGRFSLKVMAPVLVGVVLVFPVINLLKLQIRFMSSEAAGNASFVEMASNTLQELGPGDYLDLISASGETLLARMHLVSNTIAVQEKYGVLSTAIRNGDIEPYWREGIYGIAWDRLTGHPVGAFNLGVELAYAIDPDQEEGSWNSNPGYAAWLILDPTSAPLYLGYTIGLMALSMGLIKRMGAGSAGHDMLWFACLGFLGPGWIASFVLFFNGLVMVYAFNLLTARRRGAVQRRTALLRPPAEPAQRIAR